MLDKKIKKYKAILSTLKENDKNKEDSDHYRYDIDIMNVKLYIKDLEDIKNSLINR